MVVVKRWYFENRIEGLPGFLLSRCDSSLYYLKQLIADIAYALSVHLAFHFLNLFLLNSDLDPSMLHLGN